MVATPELIDAESRQASFRRSAFFRIGRFFAGACGRHGIEVGGMSRSTADTTAETLFNIERVA
jgi:hypothetical protein